MNVKEVLEGFLQGVIDDMRGEQKEKGMYASGRSARTLEDKISEGESKSQAQVLGEEYWQDQEEGGPPDSNLEVETIRRWMDTKIGFSNVPSNRKDSIAFLITRSIRRRGWDPDGQRVGITSIVNKRLEVLTDSLEDVYAANIESEILRAFRN